jgi:hypothetical protein
MWVAATATIAEQIRTRSTAGGGYNDLSRWRPLPAATPADGVSPPIVSPPDGIAEVVQQVGGGDAGATFSPQQPVTSDDRLLAGERYPSSPFTSSLPSLLGFLD